MLCPYIKINDNSKYQVDYFDNFIIGNENEDLYASDFVYDALKLLFIKISVDKKINKEQSEHFIRCIESIRIDAKRYYQNEISNKEEYVHKLEEMAEVLNGREN